MTPGQIMPWDGSKVNCGSYDTIIIEVIGISGGDSYVVNGSVGGATFRPLTGIGRDFTTPATITADGIYSFRALGYVTFTKTGSASTPTVNLLLKA